MTSKKIVRKLLLERCHVLISHLHAVHHLTGDCDSLEQDCKSYVGNLLVKLSEDFALFEQMIGEEE